MNLFCYAPKRIESCHEILNFIKDYNRIELFSINTVREAIEYAWWMQIAHDNLSAVNKAWQIICNKWPWIKDYFSKQIKIDIGKPITLDVVVEQSWKTKTKSFEIRHILCVAAALQKIKKSVGQKTLYVARASSQSVVKDWQECRRYEDYLPIVASSNSGILLYSKKLQQKLLQGYGSLEFPDKNRLARVYWVGEKEIFESLGLNVKFSKRKSPEMVKVNPKDSALANIENKCILVDSRLGIGQVVGKIALVPYNEKEGPVKGFEKRQGFRLEHFFFLAVLNGIDRPTRCCIEV